MATNLSTKGFAGKTVVITGASAGIGRTTAIAFAEAGANVVVGARREDRLKDLVAEIKSKGAKAVAVKCDVVVAEDNARLVERAVETFGSVDIAFFNAGVFSTDWKPIWETDTKVWIKNYEVNVFGVHHGLKHVLKQMIKQGKGGSVVINSSAVGLRAQENFQGHSGYSSSKFAITGLVGYVAGEAAKHNIRVNAVAPGVIQTDMTGGAEGAPKIAENVQIFKRPGKVSDISRAVLYLADPSNTFITGISLPVDGGYTSK